MPMVFRLKSAGQSLVLIFAGGVLACILQSCSVMALAEETQFLSKTQDEIVRRVIHPEHGYLDMARHKKFWSSFQEPYKSDLKARAREIALYRSGADLSFRAQIAIWKSTELSVKAGKAVLSPDHSQLRKLAAGGTLPPDLNARLEQALSANELFWQFASQEIATEKTQEGAAREGFASNYFYILAKLSRSKLRAVTERISLLLDETWDGTSRKQEYPEAGISIDWPTPFQYISGTFTGNWRSLSLPYLLENDSSFEIKKEGEIDSWPPEHMALGNWIDADNVAHIIVESMPKTWRDIGPELMARARRDIKHGSKSRRISLLARDGRMIALIEPGRDLEVHLYFVDARREKLFHLIVYAIENPDNILAHVKRLEKSIRLLKAKGD